MQLNSNFTSKDCSYLLKWLFNIATSIELFYADKCSGDQLICSVSAKNLAEGK